MIFNEDRKVNAHSKIGTLEIPIGNDEKAGWIVDGQQRVAALRNLKRDKFPVSIIGIESLNPDPSFGSHFFQNITSLRIGYFTIEKKLQNTNIGDQEMILKKMCIYLT